MWMWLYKPGYKEFEPCYVLSCNLQELLWETVWSKTSVTFWWHGILTPNQTEEFCRVEGNYTPWSCDIWAHVACLDYSASRCIGPPLTACISISSVASAAVCRLCTWAVSVCVQEVWTLCLTDSFQSDSDSLDNRATLAFSLPTHIKTHEHATTAVTLPSDGGRSSDAKC